jgi:dTDP-4-dehydrorhamnose 3,5-epimerase-like enzyme
MVVDIVFHVSSKFQIDTRSYVNGVVVVAEVYIVKTSKRILKWNKYNLGEFEGRSLKIVKRKYIIKTFIQNFGM